MRSVDFNILKNMNTTGPLRVRLSGIGLEGYVA